MAKKKPSLVAPSTAIDPTLNALFASSSGPVAVPSRDRYIDLLPKKERQATERTGNRDAAVESSDEEEEDDEVLSELEDDDENDVDEDEIEGEGDTGSDESEESASQAESSTEPSKTLRKDRKRKRRDEHDDLEGNYMRKLAEEDERETRKEKRRKGQAGQAVETSPPNEGKDGETEEAEETSGDEIALVHESLQKPDEHADIELDKANRTLFLGNVSIEAITSSKAKKLLTSHLETPLSELDSSTGPHKIESIRFRSTPFSTGAKPKRAAYITKSVMSATTKSTNAYAVYSTPLASRTALKALNGSVVLDRHLRVDSVAHPSAVDHRRCIFVGNLGFVDDETVVNTNADGETVTKKRHKIPSDTEEGLWRIFGEHAGKIESVRVPRDDKTRVGKGFAYVQFYDGNDVESALLLDGKKFPPMLPRTLRVSRAKDPRKTALAMERSTKAPLKGADTKSRNTKYTPKITPEQQSQAGRAGRLFGRSAAAKQRRELKGDRRKPRVRGDQPQESGDGIKPPEQFIFEGRRASARDGKPKDLKFGKTKGKKGAVKAKAKGRGARRAAEWRKGKTS